MTKFRTKSQVLLQKHLIGIIQTGQYPRSIKIRKAVVGLEIQKLTRNRKVWKWIVKARILGIVYIQRF